MKVAAQSFSDSGQCVVNEAQTGFCTLDWQHATEPPPDEQSAAIRAENSVEGFADFALSGRLSPENVLADKGAWSQLRELATGKSAGMIHKGASAYLEETPPKEYSENLALTSITALIASTRNGKHAAQIVNAFLSNRANADDAFSRLTGSDVTPRKIVETTAGLVADFSVYGCFELRRLPAGSKDLNGPFDIRLGVRTTYAEDPYCLRR